MNIGARTAYDVEVVVDVVYPDKSHFDPVPEVPVGYASLERSPNGTDDARLRWTIPALGGLQREEVTARVLHRRSAAPAFDKNSSPHEFFGQVTTLSHESNLHKGNNTSRVWSYNFSFDLNPLFPRQYYRWAQVGGNNTVNVSVDQPFPSPGDTVNFTITAGRTNPRDKVGPVNIPTHTPPLIDQRVDIELTDGLAVVSTDLISYAPDGTTGLSYDDGVFNIGTRPTGEQFHRTAVAYSVTLPVTVSSGAVVNEQCLTATLTGNPPPGVGRLDDKISDNVAKLCLGDFLVEPFVRGQIDAFTVYPCVGITDPPCDSSDDVRVRAVNNSIGEVLASGTALFKIDPLRARTYDAKAGHSVNDGNTVSWQTSVTTGRPYPGLRNGLELYYSRTPYTGNTSGWGGLTFGISARDVDGNIPPPGKVFLRSTSSGDEIRRAESPDYEELRTAPTGTSTPTSKLNYFLEFENLGTYRVTWHAVAKRSSLHGSENCNPDINNVNQVFCASETYTFHVGPIADLELLDGGAGSTGSSGEYTYTIVAVNNGPDRAKSAKVRVELPEGATFVRAVPSEGTYDDANHVWDLGALRIRDYRPFHLPPVGATLTLILRQSDVAVNATIFHDNDNHPYTVCIGSDLQDVEAVSQDDCEAVPGASWHTGTVYDHRPVNNVVGPGTGTPVALPAQQAGVVVRGGPLTVHESSADGPVSADYTVALGAQPTRDVTIRVANPNTGSLEVTPGSLTFNQVDWNTPKTVTVRAMEDDNAVDERLTLTHSASGDTAFSGLSIEGVNVMVDDDEPPEIMLRRGDEEISALDLNEGGEPAAYEVSLSAQPRTDVVVELGQEGSNPDYFQVNGRVDPRPLTFTSSNWNRPQRVTVRAPVDEDGDHESAVIVHSVTASSSPEFRGLTAEVSVSVTDDDVPGVWVSETSLALTEGHSRDSSKTYTVHLNVPPAADVTIMLSSDNLGVAVDTDPATSAYENTLTFTPENATIEQTVTVIALNDDNAQRRDRHHHQDTVSTTDNDYMSITVPSVTVTVTDDETPGITLSESALGIVEGTQRLDRYGQLHGGAGRRTHGRA